MQLSIAELEVYLSRIAELLERYGVVLDVEPTDSLVLEESPSGAMSFALRGFLPDGRFPPLSVLEVRERWRRLAPDQLERWEYEFEYLTTSEAFGARSISTTARNSSGASTLSSTSTASSRSAPRPVPTWLVRRCPTAIAAWSSFLRPGPTRLLLTARG